MYIPEWKVVNDSHVMHNYRKTGLHAWSEKNPLVHIELTSPGALDMVV